MLNGWLTSTYLHEGSKPAPPLWTNMLNGWLTSTYLHKGSNPPHPSEQICCWLPARSNVSMMKFCVFVDVFLPFSQHRAPMGSSAQISSRFGKVPAKFPGQVPQSWWQGWLGGSGLTVRGGRGTVTPSPKFGEECWHSSSYAWSIDKMPSFPSCSSSSYRSIAP